MNTDNPDQGKLPTLPKSPELPKLKTDPCFSLRLGVSVVKIAFFVIVSEIPASP
jgi:hypothetical protein